MASAPQIPGALPPSLPPSPVGTAITEEYRQKRESLIDAIAEGYKISPEDETKIMTEPGAFFPKALARLYVEVYEGVLATFASQLPRMIEGHQQVKTQEQEAVTAFFSENPDLNNPQYHPHIINTAKYYNTLNPKAAPAEARKEVARMVRTFLGMNANPASSQPIPTRPHVPAGTGSAAAPPRSTQAPINEWDELSRWEEPLEY
jgi:hypothetical protein